MDKNELREFERLKNRSNSIRFSSTAKENQAQDQEMTMESHMTVVCKSAIFHLRNISRIRRYLTAAATEQVIHVFVTSRLDVGNALLYRLPLKHIRRLQKFRNWAARLIDGAMKYSHATQLLMTFYWLPIAVRVECKILLLTHRALTGHAPGYIE